MVQDSRKERLWFLDLAYPEEHLKLISEAWCGGERLRWQDCEFGLPRLHSKTAFQNRQTGRQTDRQVQKDSMCGMDLM